MIINFSARAGKHNFHPNNLQSIKWKTKREGDKVEGDDAAFAETEGRRIKPSTIIDQ